MSETTRVELHCHSIFSSDGYDSPEELAARLAQARVQYAALTDHDTIEGLESFSQSLGRRGIAFIPGVELSLDWMGRPLHLLAYGFDQAHSGFLAYLRNNRNQSSTGPRVVLDRLERLRPAFRPRNGEPELSPMDSPSPGDAGAVIELVHQAGGKVFLAHPLTLTNDFKELEARLAQLTALGLDGMEVYYKPYPPAMQLELSRLADQFDLLKSGGSDFHGRETPEPIKPGISMPTSEWKAFRNAIIGSAGSGRPPDPAPPRLIARHWAAFAWRIILPSLLTLILFITTYFAMIIPAMKQVLLDRKKETIRELTNTAWSILAEYDREARVGEISVEEAQRRALERIEHMRYGDQRKDYFWITDLHPRMVMHPYRPDLNNTDLTDFRDPTGAPLFLEFVRMVQDHGEGYVEYVWQWKDNPDRMAPKESYVKGFEPWGWIIGTGLYVEDVQAEINTLTGRLINMSVVIVVILVILLLFIILQSLRIEQRQRRAEEELTHSHEKYRALVEAAGEGTMMILDRRCTYANAILLEMLGCTHDDFSLLDVFDILPEAAEAGRPLARHLEALERGESAPLQIETQLRRKDGVSIPVVVSATRVHFAGRDGMIINAKDISVHKQTEQALGQTMEQFRQLTDSINIGVFRVTADTEPAFVQANPAARRIFGLPAEGPCDGHHFFDVFHDPEDREAIMRLFQESGEVKNRIVRLSKEDGSVPIVSVSGLTVQGEDHQTRYFDGTVEDITDRMKNDSMRDQLIAELQTSLLFLNEPVRHAVPPPLIVELNSPIRQVAETMVEARRDAVLVAAPSGEIIGIVTEHDLVERVTAAGGSDERPIHDIMSAPVIAIAHSALVFEAILLMQEKGLRHVAVRDGSGLISGVIKITELMQFHRYSAAILVRSIHRSGSLREIIDGRRRLPHLVKALIEGGAKPRNITRLITTISDSILEKLVGFAIEELGPPPLPFAFAALGSEGREEQTLVTDQDNALIYANPGPGDEQRAREYFLQLGQRVCDGLAQAGYQRCKAGMMASNPKWCQPLDAWKQYFTGWINTDDPRDYLDINIFFDFRCVYGDSGLTSALRQHIWNSLSGKAAFFYHFAQTVLHYKPPIGLFGQIVVKATGDTPRTFNIKDAMTPIVNFARIYALQNHLAATNTTDRLQQLYERQVITRANFDEILAAYHYLMQRRFEHQIKAISEGRPPDNNLNPRDLHHLEETMIKQAFALISSVQKQISVDFTGVQ